MYGGSRKNTPTTPSSAPPQDALAALMEGKAPDKKSLLFPDERGKDWQSGLGRNSGSGNGRGSSQHYGYDHDYDFSARPSNGEYGGQQQGGAFDTVKNGAVRSGTYVKDTSVAGATYLKERDWSKEKVLAGKAGAATKTINCFFRSTTIDRNAEETGQRFYGHLVHPEALHAVHHVAVCRGAVFVGSNVAKGAGWLYKSSKNGVDNLMGKPK